ncbi:ATP-binding protein [Paenibacillus chungangensis]|uniref:histidine kinase n=1 Tax=Paenibacillus chungangensis TaxID=696535 RepID=A0ABW3HQS9_9BACL
MKAMILQLNPFYIILALTIICYAAYAMFSMIDHSNSTSSQARTGWVVGAASLLTLGHWTMHIVLMLASDYMLVIAWNVFLPFFLSVPITFFALSFYLHKPWGRSRQWLCAMMMSASSVIVHVLTQWTEAIEQFSVNLVLLSLSILLHASGICIALVIYSMKKKYYRMISGVVVGISTMMLHKLSLESVVVKYEHILTMDRMNDYLLLIAFILSVTTLLSLIFGYTSWLNTRNYMIINKQYKQLVDNSVDTIALIKDGKWDYMNPSGLRMFEAAVDRQLVGTSIYTLLQNHHREEMQRWLDHQEDDEAAEPDFMEVQWRTLKGNLLHTEIVKTSTIQSGVHVHQFIIRDISQRKKYERRIINAEKLSIAGELAAGIAHEIRNPLTSLKGFMQLIATGRIQQNRYYPIIKSELMRIESIISEMLMLAKPQVYEFKPLNVRQVMEESITSLAKQAQMQHVSLQYERIPEPLWVLGVDSQLKQVFMNILENAIEAMPHGGIVRIELAPEEKNMVRIVIHDEGDGISEDQLSQIGQPFYTTKQKGTGLGLMVSYKIIHNHGGEITAVSQLETGTTMTIRLPQLDQDPGKELLNDQPFHVVSVFERRE